MSFQVPRWRIGAAFVLGLYAAGVLAVAAFLKAGDPVLFAEQITAHQVTPASWSPFLAFFFVAAELALAAALIAFVWPRVLFALTILMMLGFIGITAWAWAHGNITDCGCFGRLIERGPQDVIIEDTIVIIAAAIGFFLIGRFRARPRQWTLFAVLLIPVIVLTGFGTALPIDGLVVGIGPGTDLSGMAVEGVRPPIDEGPVLVALIGPDCEACDAGLPALKAIAGNSTGPRVAAVFSGKGNAAQAWRLRHLPNFPVGYASERVIRQYSRALPVTFLLRDGIVEAVWWNRIPKPGEVAHTAR
ncbi:MAG: hypothetical protein KAY32_16550 [Candidatus Eisenbacteria sp.]|nr:hypothetical protein [Candidatus Eisenbacteria bacterium]